MKIALCQINPTVGAFNENKELILRKYMESLENGSDIVVFPEMAITGFQYLIYCMKMDLLTKIKLF